MLYYKLNFLDDDEAEKYGIAYILIEQEGLGELIQEQIFYKFSSDFLLREGILSDNLPNDIGCKLFSKRLKKIICEKATKEDLENLWFVPSKVKYNNKEFDFDILKFKKYEGVLDEQLTKFIEPLHYPRVPVLNRVKINNRNIFVLDFSSIIVVSSIIKEAIESQNILGVAFSPVKLN